MIAKLIKLLERLTEHDVLFLRASRAKMIGVVSEARFLLV